MDRAKFRKRHRMFVEDSEISKERKGYDFEKKNRFMLNIFAILN